MQIRIATRRSALALAQSGWVKSALEARRPALSVSLHEYVTRGDRVQDVPLQQVGGKGLFTREIEEALLSGAADLAVHSLKDLPSDLPDGLHLAAIPEREEPWDALVLPAGSRTSCERDAASALAALPEGARIGSSSLRRAAQLRHARGDLRVECVRGNVDTRLRKLDAGEYAALVLACAGLNRLGLGHRISARLPASLCTPAPAQGALGLQTRTEDLSTEECVAQLEHAPSRIAVTAERLLMELLGGGCSVPLGAFAEVSGGVLTLTAVISAPDGSRLIRAGATGSPTGIADLVQDVAERLTSAGARDLLSGG